MKRYNPTEIEPKWQAVWEDQKSYYVSEDSDKQKLYISCMFPYPSGAGMHTGHAFEHAIVDSVARFHRAHGKNVLNPMGWDSFGLPAENYAIKTGTAPAVVTKTNIANFKNQLKRMGTSIDWSREINTSDPEYYRWTQWIFTKFFERGLAYQKDSLQWWCPVDKTVLANEQVESGKCWRCGSEVVKKAMNQWFFKITDYADALLDEIEDLDWPQKIKTAQTNWIGRSQGAEIEFAVDGSDDTITVFSTRPDTLFGATFVVLAPEHPLAKKLATSEMRENVETYIAEAVKKSEIERQSDGKEKTGVWTGSYAINPVNGEKVPIWIADYVLGGYGTGAVMAVPGHDERDFAFADKFKLPVKVVVEPEFGTSVEDEITKDAIIAVVRNPKTNQVLVLDWGPRKDNHGGTMFVGGGIEKGEDPIEAALREVTEETGYVNLRHIKNADSWINNHFYSNVKKHHAHARFLPVLFELIDEEQVERNLDENENQFTVKWIDESAVPTVVSEPAHYHGYTTLAPAYIYHGEGVLVNSGAFDGRRSEDAREEIVSWLEQEGRGTSKVTYKMRDWLISRQRYWGAPIPIIHCPEHGAVPVPEDQLPVVLPELKDFAPKGDGKSTLAGVADWVNTTCPICDGPAQRETDTMDGYACSSWYLLRYTDPRNDQAAWSPEKVNYWAPVDYYVGGDHAVAHLLYVRFWTHVFKDMGLTDFKEPVKKLVYHGYINAEDGTKMSKSKGNVIDPLDIIDQGYGADALRTYVLFMGPIELDAPWDSRGIAGIYRFLNRVWVLNQEFLDSDKQFTGNDDKVKQLQHRTVKKVTDDYHRLSFNTAISALMEYVNELYKYKVDGFSDEVWREALGILNRMLAPLAPHMSAELWQQLGNETMIEAAGWPQWDDKLLIAETATVIVQVNGKLRAKIDVTPDAPEQDVLILALEEENVAKFVGDKKPAKVIYVPGRLINIVVQLN